MKIIHYLSGIEHQMSRKIASLIASASLAFGLAVVPGLPATAANGLCAANSDSADEEWITSLKLGSTSPATSTQGTTYKDSTSRSLGTYAAGTTHQIQMTVTVDVTQEDPTALWQEYVFVWIDLNQDGEVDLENERVFADDESTMVFTVVDQANPMVKKHTFTGNFTVPSSAYNGSSIGRAMFQFVEEGDDPILCNDDPNALAVGESAFEFGSVLDFKINVTGGVDNPELANTGTSLEQTLGLLAAGTGILTAGVTALFFSRRRRV